MIRTVALAAAFCAALPALAAAKETAEAKQVTVVGRTWIVSPVEEAPGQFKAVRQNAELLPFRPPAMIGARQAARAFKAATGCSANLDSMVKSITGAYYARVICPR